jgi:hypothetical protein
VALPWSLDTQAQFAEKAMLAWRPMGQAEWLLAQRVRTRLLPEGEGCFVANPSRRPFRGWVRMPATCLRDNYRSLVDPAGDARLPLQFESGIGAWMRPADPGQLSRENTSATFPDNVPNQTVKFWIDNLAAESVLKLRMETQEAPEQAASEIATVEHDEQGWPLSAQWPGMNQPLFVAGTGDLTAVKVSGFAPRWILKDLCAAGSSPHGDQLREKHLELLPAVPEGPARGEQTPHTRVYSQWLRHPRLAWAQRRLELWSAEPRARLTLRFHRISSEAPEILFAGFTLPCRETLPWLSNGGVPFRPFDDQLPGTCRDYFAVDGWADYQTAHGHWLWVSRDAPLLTFDSPQIWTRRQTRPAHPERLLAMLFNNFWYTNFVADEHGVMEFQFDLVWRKQLPSAAAAGELADALVSEPVVLIQTAGQDETLVRRRLFTP